MAIKCFRQLTKDKMSKIKMGNKLVTYHILAYTLPYKRRSYDVGEDKSERRTVTLARIQHVLLERFAERCPALPAIANIWW